MADEFTKIILFRDDYWKLFNRFGNQETRVKKGMLIRRTLAYIAKLEDELESINKVLQENVK